MPGYNFDSTKEGTFLWALRKLLEGDPWEFRMYRTSDKGKAVVVDFAGSLLIADRDSKRKADFSFMPQSLIIGARHFEDDNWKVEPAKWDDKKNTTKNG